MNPKHIQSGTRFGRLTFIALVPRDKLCTPIYYVCRCDCGKNVTVLGQNVRRGHTQSCGCLSTDVKHRKGQNFKHGESDKGPNPSAEYRAWKGMMGRCFRVNHRFSKYYLGKGITVCERWLDFSNFLADMGRRPSCNHSLDRYPDNNGNYEPGNVRWATRKEQSRNMSSNRIIEWNGKKVCVATLAEEHGLNPYLLYSRLNKGWAIDKALATTSRRRNA